MAVEIKNAAVTRQTVSQSEDVNTVKQVPTWSGTLAVSVFIQPMKPEAAFQQTGLELRKPHRMMVDAGDVNNFGVRDKVIWGTRVFAVMTPPAYFDVGDPASHAEFVLEQLDFAG